MTIITKRGARWIQREEDERKHIHQLIPVLDLDAGDLRLELLLLAFALGRDERLVPLLLRLGEDVSLSLPNPLGDGDGVLLLLLGLLLVDALGLEDGRVLDDLNFDVVGRSDEVEDAVSVVLKLVGGRSRDSVDRRLEVLA